jgi:hypothetical protein
VTITHQALSLEEKEEPVQVRCTLCLRHQQNMWMQDGCKVYMDSYMASNGSCFVVTWIILKTRCNTKLGDTPNAHNCWFILFYHVGGPAWIDIRWNSIWSRARSRMTSHYTWESVTTLHNFEGVLGRPLDTFFWTLTISLARLLACMWSDPQPCH